MNIAVSNSNIVECTQISKHMIANNIPVDAEFLFSTMLEIKKSFSAEHRALAVKIQKFLNALEAEGRTGLSP